MEFKIGGQYYEIDEEQIVDGVRGVRPEYIDSRHKYYVEINESRYPIKQVLSLATHLPNRMFTAQYAQRILTKLGFELKEFESRPKRWQPRVSETSVAAKYGAAAEGKTAIRFAVSLELDEDGFITASCPALVGCRSQGRSRSEAIRNIQEAIRGYVASMTNHGEAVPDVDWEVVEVAA